MDELSVPASKMMGYPCQYPVFCDWFSTDNLILIEREKKYNEYSISIKDGIASVKVEHLQSHWTSNADLNRRDGVYYNPQNDAYQDWFDLRELSNNGTTYLTKDEYFRFRNPKTIAKTRGILETTNSYTRLKLPPTISHRKTFFYLYAKNSEVPLEQFSGKFVECEIEDIFKTKKNHQYSRTLKSRKYPQKILVAPQTRKLPRTTQFRNRICVQKQSYRFLENRFFKTGI